MNDSLANDRTFLAWLRTGIALYGLGFVVSKVAFIVDTGTGRVSDARLYSLVGIVIVGCGAAVILLGWRLHRDVDTTIRAEAPGGPPPATWPRHVAVMAAIGAVVLAALIVITS